MKQYQLSLFIFRRDLRLHDNTGLLAALQNSHAVLPCFIFDPRQIEVENPYRSTNAIQFLLESLDDLSSELQQRGGRLAIFYGKPEAVIKNIHAEFSLNAVYLNHDYTPFSKERDETIKKFCHAHGIAFESHRDLLVQEPESVMTRTQTPYHVFTPYYQAWQQQPQRQEQANHHQNYCTRISVHEYQKEYWQFVPHKNSHAAVSGGRKSAHVLLQQLPHLNTYETTKDFPAISTSMLSAHIKFGTVSIREVIRHSKASLSNPTEFIRQLCWRDFYTMIAWYYPHIFGHSYHTIYDHMEWSRNTDHFTRWCTGMTGFPLVDAGMRQLTTTGFMHNRVRMIVASFLTKDLHLHWRWGERYFAQNLIDYDPAVNNGNWQWVASTGCAAQPYFRIMNPWLQQKKYDPDARYIKQWVPELRNVPVAAIHDATPTSRGNGYPQPLVDHTEESSIAKLRYQKILAQNKLSQ